MSIIDAALIKSIVKITCSILHCNFYYSIEKIGWFIERITDDMANNINDFELNGDKEIIAQLRRDSITRLYFTSYFTSVHIRQTLLDGLHFTEQELQAFESILPKYIGEPHYERESRYTRAND